MRKNKVLLDLKLKRQGRGSTGFIAREGALRRETPTRELAPPNKRACAPQQESLRPPAAYRLGVDIGQQAGGKTPLAEEILPQWSQPFLGEAGGDKW
jgi:hypothetical protein